MAGRADGNGEASDGCELAVDCTFEAPCTTTCGTTGSRTCDDAGAPTCAAPPETCNAIDDDCDGVCETGLPGCRRGVHRSSGNGQHFYTTSRPEAECCGFRVEAENFFWVHAEAADGLQPFFRCIASGGFHFYTTDTACDSAGGMEGTLGFVARDARCGAVPLFHLRNAAGDHFYTHSAPERDYATSIGYEALGIAAHVWLAR